MQKASLRLNPRKQPRHTVDVCKTPIGMLAAAHVCSKLTFALTFVLESSFAALATIAAC